MDANVILQVGMQLNVTLIHSQLLLNVTRY